MKYRVGDRVWVKPRDWYEKHRDAQGIVFMDGYIFNKCMSKFCGREAEIVEVGFGVREDKCTHEYYTLKFDTTSICNYRWVEYMLEPIPERSVFREQVARQPMCSTELNRQQIKADEEYRKIMMRDITKFARTFFPHHEWGCNINDKTPLIGQTLLTIKNLHL